MAGDFLYQAASQSLPPAGGKEVGSFYPAACTSDKIPFRPYLRAADCSPFAGKPDGFPGSFKSPAAGRGLPLYRMKLVRTRFSGTGHSTPAFRPASRQRRSHAMFRPRVRMTCRPSGSCSTSSGVLPWTIFQ